MKKGVSAALLLCVFFSLLTIHVTFVSTAREDTITVLDVCSHGHNAPINSMPALFEPVFGLTGVEPVAVYKEGIPVFHPFILESLIFRPPKA